MLKEDDNSDQKDPLTGELRLISKILAGDRQSITEKATPFERLLGILLYQHPFCLRDGIAAVCPDLDLDEMDEEDDQYETEICYYIILGEFEEAISLMDNGWLAAHFGHLLHSAGYSEDDGYSAIDPIYYLINPYATYIAEEYDMWMEAVKYNYSCKEKCEEWIEEVNIRRCSLHLIFPI